MDVIKWSVFFGLLFPFANAVHCDQERNYYKNYGYGSEITCAGLWKDNERMLKTISAYNEILLRITNSNLTDFSEKLLANVEKIRFLFISNSTIDLKIREAPLKNLNRLEHLVVENTVFSKLSGNFTKGLDSLKEMSMKNCSLQNIPAGIFKNAANVEKLDVSLNKIKSLSEIPICALRKLHFLHIDGNQIESIDNDSFSCPNSFQTGLVELDLSFNQIKSITSLNGLANLKILVLEGNFINSLEPQLFSSVANLEKINLRTNQIHNLDVDFFSKMIHLRQINLENNRLNVVHFNNLSQLEDIYLSHNEIVYECFNYLKLLPKLRILLLDHNNIDSNKMFLNFSTLDIIDLSSNRIVLKDGQFQLVPLLKHLYLKNNSIATIPNEAFKHLSELKILDISQNKIKRLSNHGIFNDLHSLQILNLSSNEFENLDIEVFRPLKSLQILDIAGNKLHNFQFNVISFLPSLRVVNIKSNLLSCDTLFNIIMFLKNRHISFNINENFQYDRENIAGIYCEETAHERQVQDYDLPNVSKGVILGILFLGIFIVLSVFVAVRRYVQYSRRRKYNIDEIELI